LKKFIASFAVVALLFVASIDIQAAAQQYANPANFPQNYQQNPQYLNSYGIQLAKLGDLPGSIRVWRHALNFDRANFHLYNNIGSALKRLGQTELAFKWYAASLKIKPTYWTYYNLALIYKELAQYNDADWAFRQSLKLKPDFPAAKRNLSRIQELKRKAIAVKAPVSVETKKVKAVPQKPVSIAKKIKTPVTVNPLSKIELTKVNIKAATSGQVFLTFDGGADDDGFDSILNNLNQLGVKSTFFLTGRFVQKYPAKAMKLLLHGHEIANHSMNHKDMKSWGKEAIRKEIEAAEKVFEANLKQRGAPYFRFPFGHQNSRVEKIVESLGYRPVYWHIDTIDWREDSVAKIYSRVKRKLREGSVILMHLGSKNGAKALPKILKLIINKGYMPSRLSDLDLRKIASLP
jgi:peptidoglycan/xylan/chitin deacetylase (PgdA/CDA1 family)/Tfp pilus assembly protein PilF